MPKVSIGSIRVVKHEEGNKNKRLKGAEYSIASSKEDALNGDFLDVPVKNGKETWITSTDSNGEAYFPTLSAGTYYIVETKAPQGYEKNDTPIPVKIGNKASEKAQVCYVANNPKSEGAIDKIENIIGTGDPMNILIYLGLILIAISIIVFVYRRKIDNNEK